jgi:hypothetical protein
MTTFAQELRQAWRSLLRRKPYFLTCAATLTLVLAASAAMFAVVNATMLRPMLFATKGEVVHLFSQPPGTTSVPQRNPLQQMEVPRLRERVRTLARLEGFFTPERVITLNREPDVAQTASVTAGVLSMMAAPIAQGRAFLESEGQPRQFVAIALGAIAGLAGGAALCALLARSMENVGTINVLNTGLAIGLISIVGIAAACLPALQVPRMHPAQVLRS